MSKLIEKYRGEPNWKFEQKRLKCQILEGICIYVEKLYITTFETRDNKGGKHNMGDLVCLNRPDDTDRVAETEIAEISCTNAVVPTIDIYSAKFFLTLTQKMVEETVDRRVSLLEKNIEVRDQEIMRAIRKMQAKMVIRQGRLQLPWWRRLFGVKQTQ
jgi:hypothetical protein